MLGPRKTSVIVLITLAELAWLAAFGLLFAYRSKVGELGHLRRELDQAKGDVARWEAIFGRESGGISPEELKKRLAEFAEAAKRLRESEKREQALKELVDSVTKSDQTAKRVRESAEAEAGKLRKQLAEMPPNFRDFESQLKESRTQLSETRKRLESEIAKLAAATTNLAASQIDRQVAVDQLRQREAGEYSVRRELTGLPDGHLRRVLFLVDTSQSMKDSPAWIAARDLIRTWIEFLPVEDCAIVNFNDKATGFPEGSYLRVRRPDGTELREQRAVLLAEFDKANGGTFTDLLRGLRHAYSYPKPDVIVLFTDGLPQVNYRSQSTLIRDIYQEVRMHPSIPILCVAVGGYADAWPGGPKSQIPNPVAFLKEVARISHGSFLGR